MTWPVSGTSSNSHSVAGRSGCTIIPRAAGGAQEDETILFRSAVPSHSRVRFVHLDPPGLIRPREIGGKGAAPCSGGLEDGSLNQHAGRRILPERNQQLASEGNNHRLAETAARTLDPLAEPHSQR